MWDKFDFNNIWNNDTESIVQLQRALGVKDDGIIGQQTIKALQRKIGTVDDGKWGNNSRTAAQNYINSLKSAPKSMVQPRAEEKQSVVSRVKGAVKGAVSGIFNRDKTEETVEQPQTTNIEDVPTMSMGEYLYRSGSVGIGRRIGNVLSVGKNLVSGFINPDGNNASLSEGGRRQMVGASLHHYDRTGIYAIDDVDHEQLGGMSGHSGTEFRQDAQTNGSRNSVGVRGYISQAANAPYHNIYGQSGYTSATGERFSPTTDGYTFNNTWNGNKVSTLADGEGNMSIGDAIQSGIDAYNSGSGVKAAIETAASNRGINVSAGRSSYVDEATRKKYEDEYQAYLNLSPEEKLKLNKRFRYS